ncbi:granulocyte-macrophage colony-stimulating factor receptor subunit alpha-like [Artibeus jamaicensis]|uniref:granulocyte-macrophage colony-stimulating factor receptor subunit alpha-like n=1 Tax=Artibeus jamaicensis TaxID=9417 RepID=UPI00235B2E83|nr:granulocyte-macrophage colony-stimulating factor receptor subunit alpha-like [Artibeus jamaicensis]
MAFLLGFASLLVVPLTSAHCADPLLAQENASPVMNLRLDPRKRMLTWNSRRNVTAHQCQIDTPPHSSTRQRPEPGDQDAYSCRFPNAVLHRGAMLTVIGTADGAPFRCALSFHNAGREGSGAVNFSCVISNVQLLNCSWAPGPAAPGDVQYQLYCRDCWDDDEEVECPHYILDGAGTHVGCHFDALPEPQPTDAYLFLLNGTSRETDIRFVDFPRLNAIQIEKLNPPSNLTVDYNGSHHVIRWDNPRMRFDFLWSSLCYEVDVQVAPLMLTFTSVVRGERPFLFGVAFSLFLGPFNSPGDVTGDRFPHFPPRSEPTPKKEFTRPHSPGCPAFSSIRGAPQKLLAAPAESQIVSATKNICTGPGGPGGAPCWNPMLQTQPLTVSRLLLQGTSSREDPVSQLGREKNVYVVPGAAVGGQHSVRLRGKTLPSVMWSEWSTTVHFGESRPGLGAASLPSSVLETRRHPEPEVSGTSMALVALLVGAVVLVIAVLTLLCTRWPLRRTLFPPVPQAKTELVDSFATSPAITWDGGHRPPSLQEAEDIVAVEEMLPCVSGPAEPAEPADPAPPRPSSENSRRECPGLDV